MFIYFFDVQIFGPLRQLTVQIFKKIGILCFQQVLVPSITIYLSLKYHEKFTKIQCDLLNFELPNKILFLGLWEVCFRDFEDFRHQYDYRFTGCWWVFEEEYYIIFDFLLPGFFIATQFFFTLCMTLVLVAGFLTWMYCFCSRDHERYLLLLLSNGANLCIAGKYMIKMF